MTMQDILQKAKAAAKKAAALTTKQKNDILLQMADALTRSAENILRANEQDLQNAQGVLPTVMLDRLRLDEKRINAMADGIRQVAALPDPVGVILEQN